MKKQDGRHLKADNRKLVRADAIALWQQGHTRVYIARMLGVHHVTIGHWVKVYRSEGMDGLQLKKRGRPFGACRTLTQIQEASVLKTILLKTPDEIKMPSLLWTRRIVQSFVKERYKIAIPIRSIGEYMKRWGLTPGKPMVKVPQEHPAIAQAWIKNEYNAIQKRAKVENAEIYWSNRITASTHNGAEINTMASLTASQHGAPPPSGPKSLIYAMSNQGTVRFMGYEGELTAKAFLDFIRRLQQSSTRKLFLITDNARIFQSRLVKAWLEKYGREIEIFLSPGNPPDQD
jgi:transposase